MEIRSSLHEHRRRSSIALVTNRFARLVFRLSPSDRLDLSVAPTAKQRSRQQTSSQFTVFLFARLVSLGVVSHRHVGRNR